MAWIDTDSIIFGAFAGVIGFYALRLIIVGACAVIKYVANKHTKSQNRYGGAEYARLTALYDQLDAALADYDALITRWGHCEYYAVRLNEARVLHNNALPVINRARARLDSMFKPSVFACESQ